MKKGFLYTDWPFDFFFFFLEGGMLTNPHLYCTSQVAMQFLPEISQFALGFRLRSRWKTIVGEEWAIWFEQWRRGIHRPSRIFGITLSPVYLRIGLFLAPSKHSLTTGWSYVWPSHKIFLMLRNRVFGMLRMQMMRINLYFLSFFIIGFHCIS